jgi:outer membrane protein OmpA-like peptidoglycan-associated protein/tetratricopeptide (TPR) repeat protein
LAQTTVSDKKMRKIADEYFSYGAYYKALPLYKKLAEVNRNDAYLNYNLGVCYFEYEKNYREALFYFQLAKQYAGDNPPIELFYYLAQSFHLKKNWNEAINNYKKYISFLGKNEEDLKNEVLRRIEMCENGKTICAVENERYVIDSIPEINSSFGDYAPLVSADESVMILTSRRITSLHKDLDYDGMPFEDIYITTLNKNNKWNTPTPIEQLNTDKHDACVTLSADGQYLYYYHSDHSKGDIYKVQYLGKNWGIPEKINKKINSKYQESSLTVSADGTTIYFVSNRKGGLGGKDIYEIHLQNDSTWSEPVNLGNTINTPYDDDSPFIHPDGKTLYFSSKGHNSIGGYDIFMTKKQADGTWSKPENLGCPLNTPNDDIHFVMTANGKHAYYASSGHKDNGREDIYKVTIKEPNIPLTMIRGTILCADSLKPLKVNLKVRDVETNEFIKYVYKPNPQTGKYLIILPPGKNYEMIISAKNYIPYKFNVYIPNQKEFYELYQTIYLKAIKTPNGQIGQGFSVDNTFFDSSGMLTDIDKQIEKEKKRQEQLQNLLTEIITKTDSLALNNFDKVIEENFDEEKLKTIGVDSTFESLLNLVDAVIENTDSLAVKNIDNLIERGFYTFAEKNVYFYNHNNLKDTLSVSVANIHAYQPLSYTDSILNFGIGESNLSDTLPGNIQKSASIDSLTLYYENGQFALTDKHKELLSEYIDLIKNYPMLKLIITGYADGTGNSKHNYILAKKRAQTVYTFFTENNIKNTTVIESKGDALAKSNKPDKQLRKVTITLMK